MPPIQREQVPFCAVPQEKVRIQKKESDQKEEKAARRVSAGLFPWYASYVVYDWHTVLGIVAGLIALFAVVPYISDILHGTTRPNIFSFALWELLLLISALAQISAGASWSILFMVGDLVGTGLIVILCLFGYGYGKYGRLELACTALAIIAIAAWQLTQQPVLAIVFAVLADALAAVPTIVKTYKDPWSEAPAQWLLIAFATLLAITSSTIFDFANLLFPAYLFLVNGTIGSLSFFGRRLKNKPQ